MKNALLPAFYMIDVEGEAVKSIIPGENYIQKISISSGDFLCDVVAFSSMQNAVSFVLSTVNHLGDPIDKLDFNPAFYPNIPEVHTPANDDRDLDKDIEEDSTYVSIKVTSDFDSAGDFVTVRHLVKTEDYKIVGKVAINPQKYLDEKKKEVQSKSSLFFSTRDADPVVRIH